MILCDIVKNEKPINSVVYEILAYGYFGVMVHRFRSNSATLKGTSI